MSLKTIDLKWLYICTDLVLLANAATGFYLLRLELASKVNSRAVYTKAYYWAMSLLYLACFAINASDTAGQYADDREKHFFVMQVYLLLRFGLLLATAAYTQLNQKNINLVSQSEERQTVAPLLYRREGSLHKSSIVSPNHFKLVVTDKVKIARGAAGVQKLYAVRVLQNGKVISTVQKSYQQFKAFQNQLNNFLKADLNEFPSLEQGFILKEDPAFEFDHE
jgi:hypothetical protein